MSLEFDPAVDYYKALGVTPSASADEIKKAYRKLAKQSHPDSTGGDKRKEARFKEVSVAYDVLGDTKRRAQYDEVRALGGGRVRSSPGGGAPGGFPGAGGFGGGNQVWDLGDLFSTMFSSGGNRAGAAGTHSRRSVRFERSDDDWSPPVSPAAPVESKVQAADGSTLTVRGNDVHSDVRVSFERAILGTVAEVATTAGTASVKIPPGTSSGRKLRLRGKGVAIDQRGPGDHYVTVQVDVPADLDDKGKQLLHDLTAHLATRGAKRK
jgi:DnaJ-class molecular chaperone